MSSFPALTAGILEDCAVVRADANQGQNSDFTFTFTVPNLLLDDAELYIQVPLNQQRLKVTGTPYSCSNGTTAVGCTEDSSDATYRNYKMTEWKCTGGNCAAGTAFSLVMSDSKNPPVKA